MFVGNETDKVRIETAERLETCKRTMIITNQQLSYCLNLRSIFINHEEWVPRCAQPCLNNVQELLDKGIFSLGCNGHCTKHSAAIGTSKQHPDWIAQA